MEIFSLVYACITELTSPLSAERSAVTVTRSSWNLESRPIMRRLIMS